MPYNAVVARAALHLWEEPPISGKNGSGAIFFSGCCLRCVFWLYREFSRDYFGKRVRRARLIEWQTSHRRNAAADKRPLRRKRFDAIGAYRAAFGVAGACKRIGGNPQMAVTALAARHLHQPDVAIYPLRQNISVSRTQPPPDECRIRKSGRCILGFRLSKRLYAGKIGGNCGFYSAI